MQKALLVTVPNKQPTNEMLTTRITRNLLRASSFHHYYTTYIALHIYHTHSVLANNNVYISCP